MNDTATLFEMPPYRPGNETQRAAAAAIAPRAATLRDKVFEFIARSGSATNEEIQIGLGLKIQTVCGRVNELQEEGRIRFSGRYRSTTSGCKAKVWELTTGGAHAQKSRAAWLTGTLFNRKESHDV